MRIWKWINVALAVMKLLTNAADAFEDGKLSDEEQTTLLKGVLDLAWSIRYDQ